MKSGQLSTQALQLQEEKRPAADFTYEDYVKKGFKPYKASYEDYDAAAAVGMAVLINALPMNEDKRDEGVPDAFAKGFIRLFGQAQRPHLEHIYTVLAYDASCDYHRGFLALLMDELWRTKYYTKYTFLQISLNKITQTSLTDPFPQMSQHLQRRIVVFHSKQQKMVYGADYSDEDEIVLIFDKQAEKYYYLTQRPLSPYSVESWNPEPLPQEESKNTTALNQASSLAPELQVEIGVVTEILKVMQSQATEEKSSPVSMTAHPLLTPLQQDLINGILKNDVQSVENDITTHPKEALDCCDQHGVSPLFLAVLLQHQAIIDLLVNRGFTLFPQQSKEQQAQFFKIMLEAVKDEVINPRSRLIEFLVKYLDDVQNLTINEQPIIWYLMAYNIGENLPLLGAIKISVERGLKIDELINVNDSNESAFNLISNFNRTGEHSIATWIYLLEQGLDKKFFINPELMKGHYLRMLSQLPRVWIAPLFRLYPDFCRTHLNEVGEGDNYHRTSGSTLHQAARAGELETLAFLLEQKADIETLDEEGNNFLHALTENFSQLRHKHHDITRPQLERYQRSVQTARGLMATHPNLLTQLNIKTRTPFLEAAFQLQADFIALFDQSDRCAEMKTGQQKTALHLCVPVVDFNHSFMHHIKKVDMLLTVKTLLQFKHLDINAQDHEGNTALHSFLYLLNFSIDKSSNPNDEAQQDLLRIILILIKHPKIDLFIKNKEGLRPIDYVAWLNRYQEQLLLIIHQRHPLQSQQKVIDRNYGLQEYQEVLLLHHAIRFNLFGICRLLLQDKNQAIDFTSTFDGEGDHFTPLLTLCALEPVQDDAHAYIRSSGRTWYPNRVRRDLYIPDSEAPRPLSADQLAIAKELLEFKELTVYKRTFERKFIGREYGLFGEPTGTRMLDSQCPDPLHHHSAFDFALLRSDLELFKLIIAHPQFVLGGSAEKFINKMEYLSKRPMNETRRQNYKAMVHELLKKPKVLKPFFSYEHLDLYLTYSKDITVFREVLVHPLMHLEGIPMPWFLKKPGLDDHFDDATRLQMKAIWEGKVALENMTKALQRNDLSSAASYLQKAKQLEIASVTQFLQQLVDPVFKDLYPITPAQTSWLLQAFLKDVKEPALLKLIAQCYEKGQGVTIDLTLVEGLYRKAGAKEDRKRCRTQSNLAQEEKASPQTVDELIKQLTPFARFRITTWLSRSSVIVNTLVAQLESIKASEQVINVRSLLLNAYTELFCSNEANVDLLKLLKSAIQSPPVRQLEMTSRAVECLYKHHNASK